MRIRKAAVAPVATSIEELLTRRGVMFLTRELKAKKMPNSRFELLMNNYLEKQAFAWEIHQARQRNQKG